MMSPLGQCRWISALVFIGCLHRLSIDKEYDFAPELIVRPLLVRGQARSKASVRTVSGTPALQYSRNETCTPSRSPFSRTIKLATEAAKSPFQEQAEIHTSGSIGDVNDLQYRPDLAKILEYISRR